MPRAVIRRPLQQRGVTLFGLLFWGVFIAFVAVVGAKVTPTVMEYYTILRAVNKVAKDNPSTVTAGARRLRAHPLGRIFDPAQRQRPADQQRERQGQDRLCL